MSEGRRLLVTGAAGFVGRVVTARALTRGWQIRAVVRDDDSTTRAALPGAELVPLGDLTRAPDWAPAMAGVDSVAHLAARVHVMRETHDDPVAAFRRMNVGVTTEVARAASRAGVRKMVYLSSIKVNGERTDDRPFSADDPAAPSDPYGQSKLEAEECLRALGRETGLSVVILRPPLVYGPGAGGNLNRLLRLLDLGVPLPLAGIRNRRSLISVNNLADAVLAGAEPGAPAGTYLVADPLPVSTPDLLQALARELGRRGRLFRCPAAWLRLAGRLLGRTEELSRLTESLEVDSARAVALLGWQATEPQEIGLRDMVRSYRRHH